MWFPTPKSTPDWSLAMAHLRREPVMAGLIERVGPCLLTPRRQPFVSLAKAIFTQQIATAVAAVLFARYRQLFPRQTPTPELTLKLTDAQLQSVGLSRQKMAYLRDLAAHFVDGRIPTRKFARMSDEEIVEALTAVHGIGRWTAEMFLIFSLNRPDVFPIDDLGVRQNLQRAFGLKREPKPKECLPYAEPWRPYRTVATWYLWRSGALNTA